MRRNLFVAARLLLLCTMGIAWFAPSAEADDQVSGLTATGYLIDQIPPVRDTSTYAECGQTTYPDINQSWDGSPLGDCGWDWFMVHYQGFLAIPEHETIEFLVSSDDGGILTIDGQDYGFWGDRGCYGWSTGLVEITAGAYPIDFWMYENGGGTCAILYWNIDGAGWEVVPAEAYTSTPPEPPTTTTTTTEPPVTDPPVTEPPVTDPPVPDTEPTTEPPDTTIEVTTTTNPPEDSTWPPTTESIPQTTTPTTTAPKPPAPATTPAPSTPTSSPSSVPSTETTPAEPSSAPTPSVPATSAETVSPSNTSQTSGSAVSTPVVKPKPVDAPTAGSSVPTATTTTTPSNDTAPPANASDEEKAAFESQVDLFSGAYDNYVPLGSKITVAQRRVVIAATAVLFVMPTPSSRRRNK